MAISMKLLIDKKNNKVLFAEAEKNCVDFLFHLLQLPLAKVVTYLSMEAMVGSLGCLYESLKNLGYDYIQPNVDRANLLKPRVACGVPTPFPFSEIKDAAAHPYQPCSPCYLYRCPKGSTGNRCIGYVSENPSALCPACNAPMSQSTTYVATPPAYAHDSNRQGYVKGLVMYVVTDSLAVKPMSNSLSYELLKLNVTDLKSVELREVSLDTNQCLALLKASMISKTVLTDIFLRKKEG